MSQNRYVPVVASSVASPVTSEGYLTTSSFSFLIFKMWIMIFSNSQDRCITWHSSKCLAYKEILMIEIKIKTTMHSSKHFTCINSSKYRNSVTEIVLLFQFCCCCCSVSKYVPTLWDPMDFSMPGFPDPHQLLGLAQIPVHWVNDPLFHPLWPPSPPKFNLSQHQGLF